MAKFNFVVPADVPTKAAKAAPKHAKVPLLGYFEVRPEIRGGKPTGLATRGMHRFGIIMPDGSKRQFGAESVLKVQQLLEQEAEAAGGELGDLGCFAMLEYIKREDADYRSRQGNYTVATAPICAQIHEACKTDLGLRDLAVAGAKADVLEKPADGGSASTEEVPF